MGLLRDSSKVFTGIIAQRVMSFIMIPVIARLLGPKDYGIFNVAAAVCALLGIVAGFAMEASIAVSATEKQAAERTIGTFLLGILCGVFFGVIAYLMQRYLRNYYSTDITNALVLMIPIFIPLGVISTSVQNYVGYLGKFKFFAIADIASPIAQKLQKKKLRTIPEPIVYLLAWCGDLMKFCGIKEPPLSSFRLRNMRADTTGIPLESIKSVTGPLPYSMEQGVEETIGWLRKHDLIK